METHRLTFDVDGLTFVGAAYATARAEERMNLDVDAGRLYREDGLRWSVSVPAETRADAVALARKNLTYDAPEVSE